MPSGARADLLVVSAVVDGGTGLFLVQGDAEGLTRTGYRTHDGTRAAHVRFDGTPAVALGDGGDRTAAIERALAEARIAYGHEAVGAMDTALRTTAEYLKTRKQFGVTLNKFQALTFRAADMYVSLELARSIALWASMVQEAGGDVVRPRTAPGCRSAARPAHRQGGHPAARRHRRDRRVLGRPLHQPAHRDRPPARRRRLGAGPARRERGEHETVDPLGAPYAGGGHRGPLRSGPSLRCPFTARSGNGEPATAQPSQVFRHARAPELSGTRRSRLRRP